MTWTYNPTLLGEKDSEGKPTANALRTAVRFLVGDNEPDDTYMQDEEINFLVNRWYYLYGTAEYVAAVTAETIASRYARETNYSGDGVSIGLGPVAAQFRELALSLRQQHKDLLIGGGPDVGGITPGEGLPPGVKNFDFGTGMHDNPETGRQNYGNTETYRERSADYSGSFDE